MQLSPLIGQCLCNLMVPWSEAARTRTKYFLFAVSLNDVMSRGITWSVMAARVEVDIVLASFVDFGQCSVYSALALKFVLRNTIFCSEEDFHNPAQTWQLQMNDYESHACMWRGHGGDWKWRIVPIPYVHKSPFSPWCDLLVNDWSR